MPPPEEAGIELIPENVGTDRAKEGWERMPKVKRIRRVERAPEVVAEWFAADARSYLRAAVAVHESCGRTGLMPRYFSPVYFLSGHSIELILKAYLASHGVRRKELQDIGHNLSEALRVAQSKGLMPAHSDFELLVDWLSPEHEDLAFRYRDGGRALNLPVATEVQDVIRAVVD